MCLAIGRGAGSDLVVSGSKDHYVRVLDMQPQDTGEIHLNTLTVAFTILETKF